MIFGSWRRVVREKSLSIVWCPLGSRVLCQTVFVIRPCCFVLSSVYRELVFGAHLGVGCCARQRT